MRLVPAPVWLGPVWSSVAWPGGGPFGVGLLAEAGDGGLDGRVEVVWVDGAGEAGARRATVTPSVFRTARGIPPHPACAPGSGATAPRRTARTAPPPLRRRRSRSPRRPCPPPFAEVRAPAPPGNPARVRLVQPQPLRADHRFCPSAAGSTAPIDDTAMPRPFARLSASFLVSPRHITLAGVKLPRRVSPAHLPHRRHRRHRAAHAAYRDRIGRAIGRAAAGPSGRPRPAL